MPRFFFIPFLVFYRFPNQIFVFICFIDRQCLLYFPLCTPLSFLLFVDYICFSRKFRILFKFHFVFYLIVSSKFVYIKTIIRKLQHAKWSTRGNSWESLLPTLFHIQKCKLQLHTCIVCSTVSPFTVMNQFLHFSILNPNLQSFYPLMAVLNLPSVCDLYISLPCSSLNPFKDLLNLIAVYPFPKSV